ncbi:hypothetical protein TUM4438_41110 [Shewanella sairae]|uniref:histidine kinase n=1 Tax=Shewanella sairae TaxID=190310 RepID=A0ABQ4PQK0_9GAMM|nr:PAS domain S-box protein [Shewanella sairae]MCL1131390.1 PAS domain S-box protein [Shewanella sairae]GIU51447.1 hypothetical protein TUM4438_41110 [Shewanella sairae]
MSFRIKTIFGIAVIEGLLLMLLVYTSVDYLKTSNQAEIQKRATSTASLFAAAAKDAVISSDLSTLNVLAAELLTTSQVLYVNIYNQSHLLVSAGSMSGGSTLSQEPADVVDGILDIERDVKESGFNYGRVELGFDTAKLDSFIVDARTRFLTIAAIEMFLVALFSWLLGNYLTRNLALLKTASQRILKGESLVQIPVSSDDEIGETMEAFNQMVKKVADKNQALESANIRLNAILQTAVDGFFIVNTQGVIEQVNPAVSCLFGYRSSELIGYNVSMLMPPHDQYMHDEYIRHYLQGGEAKIIGKGRELVAKKKDGSLFSIELSISKMRIDDEVLFLGLVKDVSDLKRAQVAAQRTESILLATLEGSKDALITIDTNGNIQEANDSACLLFKLGIRQMVGYSIASTLFQGKDRQLFLNILKEYIATGQGSAIKHSTQMNAVRSDGELVSIELTLIPVQLGQEMLLTAFIRDISRRIEYESQLKLAKEQAEQGSEAKSRFLATMSHEIRSPLNAVLGSVDLILDSSLNKEQRIYANTAKEAGTALLSTINDILDFSKIEAGQMVLEESAFSPAKLAAQVLQVLSAKAQDKGVVLAICINPNVPESLIGDGQRVRQVLHNLIDNAIKFSSGGCVAIEMWLPAAVSAEARLCCKVSDQGIGITEEAQSTLFEEFSQVHDTHNTHYSGTGLGLAICSELIQQMGGQISVDSEQGVGSCFCFDVVLKLDKNAKTRDVKVPPNSRVLLVHPNDIYRQLAQKQYRQYGVSVVAVDSIKSVFSTLKNQDQFNLIMIDEHCLFDLNEQQATSLKQDFLCEQGLMAALMTVVVPEAARLLREVAIEQVVNKPLSRDMMLSVLSGDRELEVEDVRCQPIELANNQVHLPILLAEDSPANQIVASALLTKAGFRVEIANNGVEAVDMASKCHYGLILMDMRMPEMDGIEATQKILQRNPDQVIVAMTANVQKEDVELCMNAGMKDFVPKPVNREVLAHVVNKWIVFVDQGAIVKSAVGAELSEEILVVDLESKDTMVSQLATTQPVEYKEPSCLTLGVGTGDNNEMMSIIDESTLDELSHTLGEDAMARMFGVFLTEASERLQLLKQIAASYQNGSELDFSEIDIQAHTLKSSAGSFGAEALSVAAQNLEQSAKVKDEPQVAKQLNEMIDIGEQTLAEFRLRLKLTL